MHRLGERVRLAATLQGELAYGREMGRFTGRIVGSGLLLVVALVWLWRWQGRHEADIKRRWQAVAERPRVLALRRRFAPQLEYLFVRRQK
jgi:hypothetical protein